jgi:glycine/D-amino acid oxidase-like deaminating enzyme
MSDYDAVVVGAGYYGCQIALRLRSLGLNRVALVDREAEILCRASMWNQARIHGGYHYPRAYLTALASRRSYRRFLEEHAEAVLWGMRSLYAIARGSTVSPSQFESLCDAIGAPLRRPPRNKELLFEPGLIEAVYLADEVGFDAKLIANQLFAKLKKTGVDLMMGVEARFEGSNKQMSRVRAGKDLLSTRFIFNCTYSNLERFGTPLRAGLRHELAEVALIKLPQELAEWGVTIMDGPFFSVMPVSSSQMHTLSHVRFTPVIAWPSHKGPPSLPRKPGISASINAEAMLRDATRYMPCMRSARIRGSMFEVKSTLATSERDDGRPILFELCAEHPGVISVLGSKLDNIYDVLSDVDAIVNGATLHSC